MVQDSLNEFVAHFEGEIAQIRKELDSAVGAEPMVVSSAPDLCHNLLDEFQLLQPEDRVLGSVHATTTQLDPCPSWLIKKSARGVCTWILEVINSSLREGVVPAPLKEVVIRPLLKKPNLDPGLVITIDR